ncbi:MAG: hypothetical protein V4677_06125 [Bacteroidota bacterium]
MIKQTFYFCLIVLIHLTAVSQTVGKYIYKGKEYNVYPFRIDDSEDILLVGYKIPDGDYVAFANYNFKEKFSLKKKKKHVLTDTAIVKGIFTIKNNQTQGPAVFYNYEVNDKGKQSHLPEEEIKGNFLNGQKSGVWSTADAGKPATEFITYKNGIKEGYRTRCGPTGKIYFKEKYCDGDACDTIFYYSNGKVYREYDVSSRYFSNRLTSCYDKGVDLLSLRQNKANTFYREYRNDTLTIDLKYKDGEVQPYDSIGISYYYKGINTIKYVTIKSINDHQKVMTYSYNRSHNPVYDQFFYEDGFLYRTRHRDYLKKYGKKPLFRKRKVIKVDTIYNDSYFLNPNKIIDSSIVPVLVSEYIPYKTKTEIYYIPKYKFAFEKDNNSPYFSRYKEDNLTFNRIDTINKKIYMNGRNYGSRTHYEKKTEVVFINDKVEAANRFKTRPYTKNSYIINKEIPGFYGRYDTHNRHVDELTTDNFVWFPTKETYYKNDTALNGMYYFSDVAKHKNWPKDVKHTGYTGLTDDLCLGRLVAGKKEGDWAELDYTTYPKKTPADLKAYFFSHPKKVSSYNELTYKNGMRDGRYTHYQMYDPKDNDSYSKDPIVLFKEIESHYTRDTLDGHYAEYFYNGKLMIDFNLVMGAPDGEYKEYDIEGNPAATMYFDKGKLHGKYIAYENGRIYCYANFKNNLLCDSLIYYFPNHLPSEKVFARNDTVLRKIKYFDNGKAKEEMLFSHRSTYKIGEELMTSESFIETINSSQYPELQNVQGRFKNYYETGQLLSEGNIKDGALNGNWKFYSINGVLIHEVNFCDTIIILPNNADTVEVSGFYTGYYNNSKKRCEGYIQELELSYDCFTKQDKADLDFLALDFYDINGKQTLKNGSGYFIKYDANGLRVAAGKLINCKEDSLWRYYTPEQKLDRIGNYVNFEKDGVWYDGDLEGINFEDGACFDMNNKDEVKAFNMKRLELSIRKTIYRNGDVIDRVNFNSNLNKTYRPKRRGCWGGTPSF